MSNKFLQVASDWGYEVQKLSDSDKYNHEIGDDVFEIEYTGENSSRTVSIGRCNSEDEAVQIIKKHAARYEKGLLANVSENMTYPRTSKLHSSNDAYYTFGNSAKTRDLVMNMFKERFGEVSKTIDSHGRWIFKNKDGITVGMSDIDGEGDRTWNVNRSDSVKVKEDFKAMREMSKLTPRGRLNEFADEEEIKVGDEVNHGLIGNAKVTRIIGEVAEIADKKTGKKFRVRLSSLKLGNVEEVTEAVHRVPAGTFTQVKMSQPDKNPGDDGYDWRNPNHNPSGVKPAATKPHKVKGKYNPANYPVLDAEHGTHLFDPDLIDHLKTIYSDWDTMDELDQIKMQYSFTEPMPKAGYDFDEAEKQLKVKAIRAQKLIKR